MSEYTVDYSYTGKGYFKIEASSLEEAKRLFLEGEADDYVEERDITFLDEER